MGNLLSVLFLLSIVLGVNGQTRSVIGVVREGETKEPISYCNILLIGSNRGAITDTDGRFKMEIPLDFPHPKLQVSYLGYKTDTLEIQLQKKDYIIYLTSTEKILEAVVITGVSRATTIKENPASVSLITSKAIEKTIESNIIDVLVRNTPGLNAVKTGPNISKPFIRGLGYNRVLTLFDGVRQEGQQWGDEHGIEVDAYNIERAEVIKGPASLMYGSDAVAGVVSMFPFRSKEKDGAVRGRFVSEYQSNNGLIGNGLRLAASTEHWQWAVSGSYRIAKNYTNRIDGSVYNTGFDEKNLSALFGYNTKKGGSNLNLTLYDNLQGIPDGSRDSLTRTFTKQVDEGASDDVQNRPMVSDTQLNSYQLSPLHQHIQHYRIYTSHHYQVGKGDVNILLAFQQSVRREYNHPTQPDQPGLHVRLNTINYGVRYDAPERSHIEFSVGINGMVQDNKNKDATAFPIPDFNLLDVGLYNYVKWKHERWTVSGGFRYDVRRLTSQDFYVRHSPTDFDRQAHVPDTANAVLQFRALNQTFNGISLSLGTTYKINDQFNLKANLSRGYRAPNISEIASNGLDPGAHIVYIGNRNFVPEFSFQQDIGVTGDFKNISFAASIFNNNVQNYIYLSQLVDAQGNPIELVQGNKTFQYLQASAQLYGMEFSLNVHPPDWRGFNFSSNASIVIGSNTKSEYENKGIAGEYLPFIPPLKILSTASQEIRIQSKIVPVFTVRADLDWVSAQNRYLALYHTETPTAGYSLVNFSLSTDIKYAKASSVQLQFQVNNAFDVIYQSNLSRLKYFEYYAQSPNGHLGMYGMGRNICVRVNVPF